MNMNNREKNYYVRTQLLNALLDMMKEESFDKITVSALVQKAGVGRASFYRNFTDTRDILLQESDRMTKSWGKEYESEEHKDPNEILISLLNFYKKHEEFFLAVYAAGQYQIVMETILKQFDISPDAPNAWAYVQSSIAYMIYGWVHEWMKRGMQETGTELALMIAESQKSK